MREPHPAVRSPLHSQWLLCDAERFHNLCRERGLIIAFLLAFVARQSIRVVRFCQDSVLRHNWQTIHNASRWQETVFKSFGFKGRTEFGSITIRNKQDKKNLFDLYPIYWPKPGIRRKTLRFGSWHNDPCREEKWLIKTRSLFSPSAMWR